jgi:hypothetical protein
MPLARLLRNLRSKRIVPVEPTGYMLAAGLRESLAIMKEHGVDGLSPFKDYPSPTEVTRRVYKAMIDAAPFAE